MKNKETKEIVRERDKTQGTESEETNREDFTIIETDRDPDFKGLSFRELTTVEGDEKVVSGHSRKDDFRETTLVGGLGRDAVKGVTLHIKLRQSHNDSLGFLDGAHILLTDDHW